MSERPSLLERFKLYHRDNPQVFQELLRSARQVKEAGLERVGYGFLLERLRWWSEIEARDLYSDYRFDQNYGPLFVRLIMMYDHALDGLFVTKRTSAWSGDRGDLLDCLQHCHEPAPRAAAA